MQYFVYSEAGYNHRNEDTVEVRPHPDDPSVLMCALADGQGGRGGGGEASRIAVTTCLDAAASYPIDELLDVLSWYSIMGDTDEAVSDADGEGLTTLIGLCVTEDRVCGASCGDSATQLIQGGNSLILTEYQSKDPPVGSGGAFPIAFTANLRPGWKLLKMSDGVWRYLEYEAIADIAAQEQGQDLILRLRQMQLDHNSGQLPDDFSIILVEMQ